MTGQQQTLSQALRRLTLTILAGYCPGIPVTVCSLLHLSKETPAEFRLNTLPSVPVEDSQRHSTLACTSRWKLVGREEDCRHKFGARHGPSDVVVGLAVQGIGEDSKSSGLRTLPARSNKAP